MKAKTTIKGIQELQAYNVRAIAALQPTGAAGEAIQYGTSALHRAAVVYTHVVTGSLRGAHHMVIENQGRRGRIFINPQVINPKTKTRPAVYGVEEHERGGSHAFYHMAVEERGKIILEKMNEILVRGLK
ncbi:MAG: hypothetical protein AMJ88_13450 [Anaerolineae bacterium SM23_ 63]|nr:MAG: hypothetical protein AMJ88_13450 [Anaerolineae bacterium SM23_ 63]